MASIGNSRGKLLTAGGILSIVAGAFLIISGVLVTVLLLGPTYGGMILFDYIAEIWMWFLLPLATLLVPFLRVRWDFFPYFDPVTFTAIMGGFVGVLGIIVLAGGISSIRRKSFSLSLAGAICALPLVPLGILAVIFITLGKREFGASEVNGK